MSPLGTIATLKAKHRTLPAHEKSARIWCTLIT